MQTHDETTPSLSPNGDTLPPHGDATLRIARARGSSYINDMGEECYINGRGDEICEPVSS